MLQVSYIDSYNLHKLQQTETHMQMSLHHPELFLSISEWLFTYSSPFNCNTCTPSSTTPLVAENTFSGLLIHTTQLDRGTVHVHVLYSVCDVIRLHSSECVCCVVLCEM